MKNLVLIESIFWYLRKWKDYPELITQVCPWVLSRDDWDWISRQRNLSEEFIAKFQDKVDWYLISRRQEFVAYIKSPLLSGQLEW